MPWRSHRLDSPPTTVSVVVLATDHLSSSTLLALLRQSAGARLPKRHQWIPSRTPTAGPPQHSPLARAGAASSINAHTARDGPHFTSTILMTEALPMRCSATMESPLEQCLSCLATSMAACEQRCAVSTCACMQALHSRAPCSRREHPTPSRLRPRWSPPCCCSSCRAATLACSCSHHPRRAPSLAP